MKNEIKKILIRCILTIVVTIILSIVSGIIVYNIIVLDAATIKEEYQLAKERCELLKDVAIDSIDEGNGIDVKQIPTEEIEYEISISNDKIVFEYYIKEDNSYYATISLSNDYKITSETYSEEIDSFEEYELEYFELVKGTSVRMGIFFGLLLAILITPLTISITTNNK